MSLSLTPELLRGCYDFLRACPPFKGWNLPRGEEVAFLVLKSRNLAGWHTRYGPSGMHKIGISEAYVGHTQTLVPLMAHEMLHVKQAVSKTATSSTDHNADFKRLAKIVCRHHGFDSKEFC